MKYEQENNRTYAVIENEYETQDCEYEQKMLQKNTIAGLLKMQTRRINNKIMFFYDVTSRQTLDKIFSYKNLGWQDFVNVINGIENMARSVDDYMLGIDSVIISPETIFYDATGTHIEFIYFPGTNKEFIGGKAEKQIKNLFDYMLEKFDHNDKDHLMDVYEIYQKIVQNNYKICEMTALIDSLSASENFKNTGTIMDFEEYGDTDVSGSEPQRVVIDDVVPEVIEEEEEVKNTNIIKMIKVIKLICVVLVGYFIVRVMFPSLMPLKINTNIAFVAAVAGIVVYIFSDKVPDKLLTHFVKKEYIQKYETQINYQPENDSNINNDVIEKENSHTQEYEHTMLLSDYMESIKKKEPEINLIYTGDEDMENISVYKLPCVVGSMEGRCNKVIHNRLVSHIHMCIVKINDDFYIEDMNSTNGTSVNGRRIATNQRCVIKNGDDIYIAALPYKVEIT